MVFLPPRPSKNVKTYNSLKIPFQRRGFFFAHLDTRMRILEDMKFVYTILLLCVYTLQSNAQTFVRNPNLTIPDAGGLANMAIDSIILSGLPNQSNTNFGLMDIGITINHPYDGDLSVWLKSPSGQEIALVRNNGGAGNNFSNTHFNCQNTAHIYLGTPPYTGNYQATQWLGVFNQGNNPNGKWYLKVSDCCAQDIGTLLSWSLTFSTSPCSPLSDSTTLPIIKINTTNAAYIVDEPKIPCNISIIDNASGINHYNDVPQTTLYAGVEYRGSTSQWFPAKPYAVQTWDAQMNDLDTNILGFPKGHNWIFYPPFNDKSLLRNVLTYKLSNEMGHYASRTKFFELYVNGNYEGIYVLMEKIGRDNKRVDISKNDSSSINYPSISGGYIFKIDKSTGVQNAGWNGQTLLCDTASNSQQNLYYQFDYPSPDRILPQQANYLQGIVNAFENSIRYFSPYDTVNGYRKYISAKSFIDHSLLVELSRNIDGYRLSSYYHKDRDDKDARIKAGPVWDYNLSYGNGDYLLASDCTVWQWDMLCPDNPVWWRHFYEQDTLYRQEYKCRYTKFRQTVLDSTHLNHLIDSFVQVVQVPQQKHYTRWPILGSYIWPNAYYPPTYAEEIDTLKNWLFHRLAWMDQMLFDSSCLPKLTGIKSIQPVAFNYSLYPNPAYTGEVILLHTPSNFNGTYNIYNALGISLGNGIIHASSTDISPCFKDVPAGIYWVQLKGLDASIHTQSIVIQQAP